MRFETVLVTFEDGEHPVDVRHWRRPDAGELQTLDQTQRPIMVPDWERVLPGFIVTAMSGGYQARPRPDRGA